MRRELPVWREYKARFFGGRVHLKHRKKRPVLRKRPLR